MEIIYKNKIKWIDIFRNQHKPSLILNVIICYKILKDLILGLKENLNAVKEELNTEEQFLESMIKAERFYKKYKKQLISFAIIFVVVFVGYSIETYIKESNIKSSNIAYLKLLSNPKDMKALAVLKKTNKNLYYAYEFQLASQSNNKKIFNEVIKNSNDSYLKDLSIYQISSLDNDKNKIESYINNAKIGLLKNMALLEDAFLLLKKKNFNQAKIKLSMIDVDSPVKNIANELGHFSK